VDRRHRCWLLGDAIPVDRKLADLLEALELNVPDALV
jgi:hypothetical protein